MSGRKDSRPDWNEEGQKEEQKESRPDWNEEGQKEGQKEEQKESS